MEGPGRLHSVHSIHSEWKLAVYTRQGGGGGGGGETGSETEKRCSHNLQSDHPA